MAAGALPTLKRPAPAKAAPAPQAPAVVPPPVFHSERLAVQVVSENRTCFLQGKYLFSLPNGGFVGEVPEGEGYFPTPQQEENNRRAKARQSANAVTSRTAPAPAMPEKMLQMAKENAQAAAAEMLSE